MSRSGKSLQAQQLEAGFAADAEEIGNTIMAARAAAERKAEEAAEASRSFYDQLTKGQ